MPLQATSGAASYDAFGGGVPAVPNYIEDVFSTYLYTGNGSTQTITNGIDLSGKGGLVWLKNRTGGSGPHNWYTTAIGSASYLDSSQTSGLVTYQEALSTYNSDGFSLSSGAAGGNENTFTYASWTFRKQPKFFDVVTYTGNGASNRSISHNLGSTPGCIIVKRTDASDSWIVWHRAMYSDPSILYEYYLRLNSTAAIAATYNDIWGNSNNVTSASFQVSVSDAVNASGGTYVAYLFAHDAGGFGLTGTDNVISCGSYTGNGSTTGPIINLGYEPQWVLIKSTGTSQWYLLDNMRGIPTGSDDARIYANLSIEETNGTVMSLTSTGFQLDATSDPNVSGQTYIYIAIRRGPMKVPTSGTSVFGLSARTGTDANATVTGGQTDDAVLIKNRGSVVGNLLASRLTGTGYVETSTTTAEVAAGTTILQANPWDVMDGVKVGTTSTITNASSNTFINYLFKRAPSFFDVVCYKGTGVAKTEKHNLGVAPELIITKNRTISNAWGVYSEAIGNTRHLVLNTTASQVNSSTAWNSTSPTASVFSVGTFNISNENTRDYIAYLFATCAGVSKVGGYTGTGTTLQIDCGFASGARFVLIKRASSTGDWYVWDTARGIVSGNDPYLLLNTQAADVTTTDYIDTYSAGFEISSTAPAAINASGGTFIFLAIA